MPNVYLNNIPFDPEFLADTEANAALGRFMTVWSQIEVMCGFIFRSMTGFRAEFTIVFQDNVDVKEQIAIVQELSESVADQSARQDLVAAMGKVQTMSTKRNKIVHASWGRLDGVPARFYNGLSHSRIQELFRGTQRGKTYPGTWVFTVAHLNQLTIDGVALRDELEALVDRVKDPNDPASQMQELRLRLREARLELARLKNPDLKSGGTGQGQ